MTSRSKEKVAAAFRKLFRSSDKIGDGEGSSKNTAKNAAGSPSRRFLRGFRDVVTPAQGHNSLPTTPTNTSHQKSSLNNSSKKKGENPNSQNSQKIAHQKSVRARRLMKELKEIQKSQNSRPDPFFTVELVNDNLFEWHIKLLRLDPESELASDMRELGFSYILLHMVFPENFPFAPPFMRVMAPRIEKGFVMEGGAICMELLTPRGWASAYTVEAVVMQFAASIVKGQGRIARKTKGSKDFTRRSAEESFKSLVKTHEKYGWVTPALSDG